MTPPGFSERIECPHVALPTVSNTPSTFSGSLAPDSKLACAPSDSANARLASERPVTQTRSPAARPSWINAVDTPPELPCTSMVCPGRRPDFTKIIR
jgi:hypothetical protein